MIFDSWFLVCFSKMVVLHKKCHYFRKNWGDYWTVFVSSGNVWLHSFNNEIALGRAEINLIKY